MEQTNSHLDGIANKSAKAERYLSLIIVAGCALLICLALDGGRLLRHPITFPEKEQVIVLREGGDFFKRRDLVKARISRKMTVNEFIALYQLEQCRDEVLLSARVSETDVLEVGREIEFHLTPREISEGKE